MGEFVNMFKISAANRLQIAIIPFFSVNGPNFAYTKSSYFGENTKAPPYRTPAYIVYLTSLPTPLTLRRFTLGIIHAHCTCM